ncbi:coiled-coil domain-containing protein 24 [Aulostomus maculatus]
MQSTSGKQLRCPDQSLWSLIAEHVPESELPKIHAALGCSLVDMYTEVHAEAVMWHKIWQESQAGGSLSSRPGTPLSRQQRLLADPPAIKELVRAEIRMLLQNLKEKAIREGRHDDEFLLGYKRETVAFAWGCFDTTTDPGDSDTDSRPSSHSSVQSNAEDEIESVKNKLNITDIEQVVDHIKEILKDILGVGVNFIEQNLHLQGLTCVAVHYTSSQLA